MSGNEASLDGSSEGRAGTFSRLTGASSAAIAVFSVHDAGPEFFRRLQQVGRAKTGPYKIGKPRRARLLDRGGRPADDVLVLRRSERCIEIHCHGGWAVSEAVRSALADCGLRELPPPEPCDFRSELRGFLASASSRYGVAAGLWQKTAWNRLLRRLATCDRRKKQLLLGRLLGRWNWGRALIERPLVALVGRSNAGKSTLFNALLRANRALVAQTPGTTRDLLRAEAVLGPLPVVLQDGAGFRRTGDQVEAAGVDRLLSSLNHAKLVIHVVDGTKEIERSIQEHHQFLLDTLHCPSVFVASKSDRVPRRERSHPKLPGGLLWVSALNGAGLGRLGRRVAACFGFRNRPREALIWDERQFTLLRGLADKISRGAEIREDLGLLFRGGSCVDAPLKNHARLRRGPSSGRGALFAAPPNHSRARQQAVPGAPDALSRSRRQEDTLDAED